MHVTLADALGPRFANHGLVVAARAITALYLGLRALAERRGEGEVVVPATVCPSVPLAVLYAGHRPRFCDVDPGTFCMTPATAAAAVGPETRAILLVYLFGKAVDPAPFAALAESSGAMLIEDLAHAPCSSWDGEPLGTHGDFTLYSFNDAKVLRGTAGALLTRDPAWAERIEQLRPTLPAKPPADEARFLGSAFRDFTHGLYHLLREEGLTRATGAVDLLRGPMRALFLHEAPPRLPADALRLLADPRGERERRHGKIRRYREILPAAWEAVGFAAGDLPWRLPVLTPGHAVQAAAIRRLRAAGVLVSNHFFPASHVLGDATPGHAREIGLRALNFWLDEKATPDSIETTARELARLTP